MEVLAKITQISPVYESTNQSGESMSRVVVTFLIGDKPFHVTVFKKTENLARWPFATDGYVEGAVGTLTLDTTSEVKYSKDNTPYVNYRVSHRWKVDYNPSKQPAQEASQQEVVAGMAEAAAMAEAHINPETGMPF